MPFCVHAILRLAELIQQLHMFSERRVVYCKPFSCEKKIKLIKVLAACSEQVKLSKSVLMSQQMRLYVNNSSSELTGSMLPVYWFGLLLP